MAACTRESVGRVLGRQLEMRELDPEFREMVAAFTGVRDEGRIRTVASALARAISAPRD